MAAEPDALLSWSSAATHCVSSLTPILKRGDETEEVVGNHARSSISETAPAG
jgi:hypothetical protein